MSLDLMCFGIDSYQNALTSTTVQDASATTDDIYKGKLKVGLAYAPQAKMRSVTNSTSRIVGTLHVAIHQAKDLPVMDENGLTDATVKLYLLPNQSSSGKRKTKVINQNLNPAWDEQFTYENVYMDDLSSRRVLEVTVWDYDRRGSNDFIGGLRIGPRPDSVAHTNRVKDWMDSTGEEVNHWEAMLEQPGEWVEQWHDIRSSMEPASKFSALSSVYTQKTSKTQEIKPVAKTSATHDNIVISGEVLLGVYYKKNQLHVHVNRARGLAVGDSNGYSDPYIKVYLLPSKAKQKTSIKKKTLDPVYKETLKVTNKELLFTISYSCCSFN